MDVDEDVHLEYPAEHMEVPVREQENPLFQQFAQFRAFQAFMAAQQPMPQFFPVHQAPYVNHAIPPYYGPPQQHVNPGTLLAMSQVRTPTLEGLRVPQIKSFRLAYRRYASKCPSPTWVRLPGQFVLQEHLETIATLNSIDDLQVLKNMMEADFFICLCRMYNATMTSHYCRLIESVKMTAAQWSLELFLEYVEDFRFHMQIAGDTYSPPEAEMVKMFIKGIQPLSLHNEIKRKGLQTLEDVIVRTADVIIQYKAVMDLQESFSRPSTNKSSKKFHSKVTEDSVALPVTPQVVVPPPKQKKDETNAKKSDVACYKCLVKGHVAPNCPNAKHPKST